MEVGGKHHHIVDAVDVAEGEIEPSPEAWEVSKDVDPHAG